jgi:hypothetical protein
MLCSSRIRRENGTRMGLFGAVSLVSGFVVQFICGGQRRLHPISHYAAKLAFWNRRCSLKFSVRITTWRPRICQKNGTSITSAAAA